MIQNRLKTGREGRMVLLFIGLVVGFLALAGSLEASPIFTGHTDLSTILGKGMDGTVNYALFTSTDFSTDAAGILTPTSPFVAGAGSGNLNLGSGYVYLFQVTNSGSNSSPLTSLLVSRSSGPDVVTSWGYFGGIVFDNGGPVGATNSLDPGASVGFSSGSAVNPTSVQLNSTSVQAGFNIANDGTSSLIVYTSPYAPDSFNVTIQSGVIGATERVPEPGTLLLMTLGLAGLAGFRRGTRRKERGR